MKPVIFSLTLVSWLLFGCASQPPAAQLATVCNSIAAGYNTAAAYKAEGKLSASQITTLTTLEPGVEGLCNATNPPNDLTAALTSAQSILDQIALINSGVK